MKRASLLAFRGVSLGALTLVLATGLANGQSTFGTILGSLKDPADAVIVGAKVTVTNEGTNIKKETASNALGNYEVTHLNPGLYTVAVEAAGFRRHINQHINLETSQILRIDAQLAVGEVTESITVSAEAPAVESETGTISGLQTGRQLRELPMNFVRSDGFSGGIYRLVSMTPGAIRYEGTGSNSIAGARSHQVSWLGDGVNLGDQGGNNISSSNPSLESIQEMKVTMVNNSAEYGNVATVTVTTKSGTNQLHGSGFYQYTTGSLNARNFFQSGVPFRVYNGFAGTMGGPVMLPGYDGRNKTFFFGAFEGNTNHQRLLSNLNVPSAALRRGDFSQVFTGAGNLIVIRDPANGQPFLGNIVPDSRLSPVSRKIQDRFYPLPNFGDQTLLFQNYRETYPQGIFYRQYDGRIDHQINDKNSLFGRLSVRDLPVPICNPCVPAIPLADQLRRVRNFSLSYTSVISPKVLNEFRGGFSWHENKVTDTIRGLPLVNELGITGLTSTGDNPGMPAVNITGFLPLGRPTGTSSQRDQVYDFTDNVTITTERHTLKAGVNFKENLRSLLSIPNAMFGDFSFTGAFTGHAYADFLLGIPQTSTRSTEPQRTYGRNQAYAVYIQDDFKAHPNLTLNFGLRYELITPFADKFDRMFNFDTRTGNLVVPTQTVLQRDVNPIFPSSIRIVTADQAGFPGRGLRNSDGNNLAPRFGFAWRPFGHARSVVRGGIGIYHTPLFSSTFSTLSGGGPFSTTETFTNSIVSGVPLFQFPNPFQAVGAFGTVSVAGVEPNLFSPYAMQWNLTVEQEYASVGFRASYIATRSVNLLYRRNINQPIASVAPFNNNRRPYPQLGNIPFVSNGTNTMYHALQLEAERKFSGGLFFTAGWTWAKQLGHGIDGGELGAQIENTYDRRREYGDDLWLSRHRFVASYLWELP
ncbi:MAG: TonB-dependent receptor, partial [Acidobacteria bacterium]|nr:TonB-dependent receptor [Acidobacteriota bacterium]